MKTILDLQPTIVWKYFHEITQVPRPSKKEGKIIRYLENFAAQHNLPIKKDSVGNILISKAATPGYEQLPTVVLQSHMDMVCEKNNDVTHDFDNDPIETVVDGEWLRAKGTTLGADNGSGMAAELALLVLLLQKKALAGRDYMMSGLRPMKRKTLSGVRSVLVVLGIYFVAFLAVLPQLTVAVTSFVKPSGPVFLPGFGFESYAEAFGKMSDAILNSFLFSLSAIAIMVFSALLISYLIVREQSRASTLIDMMVMFPYVIPGAVLGIMLSSTFNGMPLPYIIAVSPNGEWEIVREFDYDDFKMRL